MDASAALAYGYSIGLWIETASNAHITGGGVQSVGVAVLMDSSYGTPTSITGMELNGNTSPSRLIQFDQGHLVFIGNTSKPPTPGLYVAVSNHANLSFIFTGNDMQNQFAYDDPAVLGAIWTNKPMPSIIGLTPLLFAQLPTCAAALRGRLMEVSDSNTTTWGATIAGGGIHYVLAHCNGGAWTVTGG